MGVRPLSGAGNSEAETENLTGRRAVKKELRPEGPAPFCIQSGGNDSFGLYPVDHIHGAFSGLNPPDVLQDYVIGTHKSSC